MIDSITIRIIKEREGEYYIYSKGFYKTTHNSGSMFFASGEFISESILVDTYFERLRENQNTYIHLRFSEDDESEIDPRIIGTLEKITRIHNIWVNPSSD